MSDNVGLRKKISPLIVAQLRDVCQNIFPKDIQLSLGWVESVSEEFKHLILPVEWEIVQKAVDSRKKEFATGRILAKQALAKLTGEESHLKNPILKLESRGPIWPSGYCGTISHTKMIGGAAVASTVNYRSLGFDIEALSRVSKKIDISKHVCVKFELDQMNQMVGEAKENYLIKVFSAKESLFKCLNPIVNKFFGFEAVQVTFSKEGNSYECELLMDLSAEIKEGQKFEGQVRVFADFVVTGMFLT